MVDQLIDKASKDTDADPIVQLLGQILKTRRTPKLVHEELVLEDTNNPSSKEKAFRQACQLNIPSFVEKQKLHLGQFFVCQTAPLKLEKRGSWLSSDQARDLKPEEKEEIIKVIDRNSNTAKSIVDIKHSIVHLCSNHYFQALRLYFVSEGDDDAVVADLRSKVTDWFG